MAPIHAGILMGAKILQGNLSSLNRFDWMARAGFEVFLIRVKKQKKKYVREFFLNRSFFQRTKEFNRAVEIFRI